MNNLIIQRAFWIYLMLMVFTSGNQLIAQVCNPPITSNCQTDSDGDGLCDGADPCKFICNTNPSDVDGDLIGDECDNSPNIYNPDQADDDGDGIGNVSDPCTDIDHDGVCDPDDQCPGSDDRQDDDGDGIPDGCDSCIDRDRDNICDSEDDCIGSDLEGESCNDGSPCTINDTYDSNCNCRGTYIDSDGDGTCDALDRCEGFDDKADINGDGVPDGCDNGTSCGVCNLDDRGKVVICRIPLNPDNMRTIIGNCNEMDDYIDSDGRFVNEDDRCGPCQCEYVNDIDTDGDGVCDRMDRCPDNPNKRTPGKCGCEDQDTDEDGVCDSVDLCPLDANKTAPDECDCGDQDTDGDGVCDSIDQCPTNPAKSEPGKCGCEDQDTDGDGVCDSIDKCPGSDDSIDLDYDDIPDACDEVEYCIPTVDNTFERITLIRIGDSELINDSGEGYVYHRENLIPVEKRAYELELVTESIDDICEFSYKVYIDINGDGDFEDDGEEIVSTRSGNELKAVLHFTSFNVGRYRMRIIAYYGRIFSSCENGIKGEVADMTLDIIDIGPCSIIGESFDYPVGTALNELNGGAGWSGAWMIEEAGNTGGAILSESIASANSTDNKIGFLVNANSSVVMKRPIDGILTGSQQLYFSTLIEKGAGTGKVEFEVGGIKFGLNESDKFFLQDSVGQEVEDNKTYELSLLISLGEVLESNIEMTVKSTADNTGVEEFKVRAKGQTPLILEDLTIAMMANSGFIPFVMYLDEINMSCDTESVQENSRAKSKLKAGENKRKFGNIELEVTPNPLVNNTFRVEMKNSDGIKYPAAIYKYDGSVVWQGQLYPDMNIIQQGNISAGIYLISVLSSKGMLTKKILKN